MKRIISLSLALLLCVALSVPAFASERAVPSVAEGLAPVQITLNQGGGSYDFSYGAKDAFFVESPMRVGMDESGADALDGYHAVSGNSTFTLRHNGKAGDGSFIEVSLDNYVDEDGTRNLYYYDGGAYLVNAGYFIDHALDPDVPEFGGLVNLTAGQSVTFSVPFDSDLNDGDELVMLHVSIVYPELDYSYWTNCWLKLDEKNAAIKPQPTAPTTPTAYASTQNVLVNGKSVEFQCYALKDKNGNDTNYIKLRDVANVLNGTSVQFQVGWDGAVNIETGKSYTSTGSEMSTPFSGDRAYETATAETRINGTAADLSAIVLTDDSGNGYTYYKLRDLGSALGFKVDWAAEKGIFIETA
ncbi:copper amine oxidase N-terminal domain-containing protein [Pseudoflavonifractor sp. MSJ-37]|uniref:copper amine oxidase N-terminal domain-containing protein n=1 Tax=Pseudoflavonifractor sp. MSJ-37 TaxID=2841531 RepID=UPI001C10FB5F|nr:copper amine oxidase N-terminal domain-containing protein [Pseudoflavonifractor sp. MSJ-37]MBU5435258.1 copper amine oxidase N-terminal domain-containing protein [Pseudoflavonifractor sp. MSJ-37]